MAQVARNQPQGLVRLNRSNPLTRGIIDAWLPGITSRGIVSGVDSSAVASGSKIATPAGVGFSTTATGRRYSTTILNGQPVAWLIVASRDNTTPGATMSIVRKDGTITPMQETGGNLQCAMFNGASFGGANQYGPINNYIGRTNTFCGVCSPSEKVLLSNGSATVALTNGGTTVGTGTNPFCIGATESGGELGPAWTVHLVVMWQGTALPTSAQLRALSANPYQLFDSASQTQFPIAAAAPAGVSGSITWTEASDSAAAAGSVTVSGAAAWTEAADSAALAGSVGSAVSIAASWTEAADSVAITSTARVNAAAAWTEAADTAAIAATARVNAAGAWTEAADSISMAGSAGNSVAANINWTEAADVTTVAGTIRINAAGSWTEAGDTAAIVVNVAAAQYAALSWTEAPDGIAIAANVVAAPVVGTIAWTEAADISAVATYPRVYAYTLMRADPVSAAGYISGSATQFTLMRSNPLYAASAMTDAPLNRTVNLI